MKYGVMQTYRLGVAETLSPHVYDTLAEARAHIKGYIAGGGFSAHVKRIKDKDNGDTDQVHS